MKHVESAAPSDSPGKTKHYASVRSCVRGLQLLGIVNVHRCIHLKDLVKIAGLPRSTVIRFLETLIEAGYVSENADSGTYEPAPRVLTLASGFHFENWLETVSTPILIELIGKIGWPSDLLFLYGDRMRAKASNRAHCAMEINRSFVGVGGPLCNSASGRAYLAWCPEPERERLLHQIAGIREHKKIRSELQATRDRGYAIRDPALDPKIGSISIPVRFKGAVVCTLTTNFVFGTSTDAAVAQACLTAMRIAASQLEAAYARDFAWDSSD